MSRHVSNDLKARARDLAGREGIPYSAALARLRTPSAGHSHPQPADPAEDFEYLFVHLPLPDLQGARPCEFCLGTGREHASLGSEHTLFFLRSDGDRPDMGVEVACDICHGCGRAVHDPNGCGYPHTDPWPEPDEDEGDEDRDPVCFSCHGHKFSYVAAFPEGDNGPQAGNVHFIRMPCGCTEDEMTLIREVAV
jgi:hypothetical protein